MDVSECSARHTLTTHWMYVGSLENQAGFGLDVMRD